MGCFLLGLGLSTRNVEPRSTFGPTMREPRPGVVTGVGGLDGEIASPRPI